ncbi:MAG: hypothetical protein JWO43_342 [Candidatus Adlerbacteria bacterium]|nr:hypothetical protein [Candidatus Adlerbacteria bacterium]
MMRNNNWYKWALVLVAIVIVGGYGLFEGRRILSGPEISLDFPRSGSATSSVAVVVSGMAQNIAFLTINGRPAYTDAAGHFSATLSPHPGYTSITVAAKDRFGREASMSVHFTVLNFCTNNT